MQKKEYIELIFTIRNLIFYVIIRVLNADLSQQFDLPVGPTITASVLQSLFDSLRLYPAEIDAGIRKFGLTAAATGDPRQRIPLKNYVGLFEWLAQELGQNCLGLNLSQRAGPEMIGAVGYLFLSSATLEMALQNLVRYIRAIQDSTQMDMTVEDGYAKLSYRVLDETVGERRQDCEYSQGFNWRLIQLFSDRKVPLVRVDFEHERKGDIAHYRRIFQAPVLFGQSNNTLYLRRDQLQSSSSVLDPNLLPILEAHVNESVALQSDSQGIADQVETCLTDEVLRAGPRAKVIANRLALSEVTLHRRLRAEGASFKQVVDGKCKAVATRMIAQQSTPISAIARRLGYAEPACFTRAFRRWFGVTPREYRKQLIQKSP